jgi:secreted Zn-dependent insulinase-like peptidase
VVENGLDLKLPPENELIPSKFYLIDLTNSSDIPTLIQNWTDGQVWLKQDQIFKQPKAFIQLRVFTTDLDFGRNPRSYLFANLWKDMVKDNLQEYMYQGYVA